MERDSRPGPPGQYPFPWSKSEDANVYVNVHVRARQRAGFGTLDRAKFGQCGSVAEVTTPE